MTKDRDRGNRVWLTLALIVAAGIGWNVAIAIEPSAIEKRILADLKFLASDELEGRGVETAGIAKAADYIAKQFNALGLKTPAAQAAFAQAFKIRIDSKVDPGKTQLVLSGPDGKSVKLEVGKDFSPLSNQGADAFRGPVVFAGYGITADELKYDDYKGIDVAGKVVLILRREPQQADEKSPFNGKNDSPHASLISKAQNAWTHKAAAVLVVNDPYTVNKPTTDLLVASNYLGVDASLPLPMAHVSQKVAEQLIAGTKLQSLKDAEAKIDKSLACLSQPLDGWIADGRFTFQRVEAGLSNVVGVLEGAGPAANETVVIGAHYDHLGYGGRGSLAGGQRAIHNGADDNASGTSALIELARRYASRSQPPSRRLVFIAFSAEEVGLRGSQHYVRQQPLYPLKETIAMLNFDMVGRLASDTLTVFGVQTAKEFEPLVDRLAEVHRFKLKKIAGGNGPSDHASFYRADIPVLHFYTGGHLDYHRPSDDVDKINLAGIRRVADYSEQILDAILAQPARPQFVKVKDSDPHEGLDMPRGEMAYLGTVPDYNDDDKGVLLNDVRADSPAQKAGLQKGDLIVDIAGMPIQNARGLSFALRKHKPDQTIDITVLRGGEKKVFKVTLGRSTRSRTRQ